MSLIHKILVATDFSAPADAAVGHAIGLARTFEAPLVILHVYAPPVLAVPDGIVMVTAFDLDAVLAQLRAGLDQAAARARASGAASVETALVEGVAWRHILDVAADRGCDLIAVGNQGRGAVARFVLGSVAEKVVRKAPCAVLTVHAPL